MVCRLVVSQGPARGVESAGGGRWCPGEDVEDADTVRDAAAGEDVGEEAPEKLRRRGDEELAVRRGHRRRPSSGGRARLLAAAGRADVEEGLQSGRPKPRRHKEGRER